MSSFIPSGPDSLETLLAGFYRLEPKEKGLKQFVATDSDLNELEDFRPVIRNMVLDAFSMQANPRLTVTFNKLPDRPYASELATAALHCIAKALENRDCEEIGYMYLEHAQHLLRRARRLHNGDDWHDVAEDLQALADEAERQKNLVEWLKGQPSKNQKEAKKKQRENSKKRNAKLRDELKKAYDERLLGKEYKTPTALRDDLWPEIEAAKIGGNPWRGMTALDVSKIGKQTVFDQIQKAKIIKK